MFSLALQRLNFIRYINSLGKDLIVYAFSEGVLRCFGLLSVVLFTRFLNPESFGLLSTVQAMIGLIHPFMGLGIDCAYCRLYFDVSTHEERRVITTSTLLFSAIWMSFITTCLYFSFNDSLYTYAGVGAAANLFAILSLQPLRNQFKTGLYALSQALFAVSSLGCSLLFVTYFEWGIEGVILGPLAGAIITQPLRFYFARDLLGAKVSFNAIKDVLRFGIPLVPASISYWVFTSSDRIVIASYDSLEDVGYYSIASTLLGMVALVISVIGNAWTPHALKVYQESSPEQASRYYGQALLNIIGTLGFICFLIILFSPELVRLFSGENYLIATSAVLPLALASIANGSTQVTVIGITLSKRTSYLFYYSCAAAIINLVLNLLLVPYYGMVAAAWTTACAYVLLTLFYFLQSSSFLRFEFNKLAFIHTLLLVCAFSLIADRLSGETFLIKSSVIFAFIGLLYAAKINPITLILKEEF